MDKTLAQSGQDFDYILLSTEDNQLTVNHGNALNNYYLHLVIQCCPQVKEFFVVVDPATASSIKSPPKQQ